MYLDPLIVVYHDIMVDSEVAKIKEVASPRVCTNPYIQCRHLKYRSTYITSHITGVCFSWEMFKIDCATVHIEATIACTLCYLKSTQYL